MVKELARDRVPVFAGAGAADTKKTVESVKRLAGTGVDGILAVAPCYVRPDQRGILSHFEAVAASTSLPIVLYNIPSLDFHGGAQRGSGLTCRRAAGRLHVTRSR
jgi:4-hydroxy-tetrahydrodipicolinate synthase